MSDQTKQVRRAQQDDGRPAEELVAAYAAGPAMLHAALGDMDAAQLQARPVAGRWSSLEVLCHLADCEQFLADRMKRTIGTEKPLLVGIDNSPYTTLLHYHDRDPLLQLELIDVTRRQMAADLRLVPAEAWARQAIHTETGLVTLRQLLLHTVRHLEYHVGTIEEKRLALGLPGTAR